MKKILFILTFISISALGSAQVKVADNFFRDYAYYQATELYLEVLKKGDTTEHVLTRLGDCYYNNSNVKMASYWYKKAVTKYNDVNPEYIYKYIQTLRSLNQFSESKKWTQVFKERKKNDKRVKQEEDFDIEKFEALENTERVYVDFKNLDLNTEYSDFGSFEIDNKLYFASTRVRDTIIDEKLIYQWNKEPFLNIYQAEVKIEDSKQVISDPVEINSNSINSAFHEASVTITNDGKTIYFTRDNLNKKGKKVTYDKKGTSNLRIFRAKLENDKWSKPEDLPFNGDDFSNGSPALSPDNNTLYFVSDREDGFGQTDLYKIKINKDGTFGEPKNLGSKINTEGRENFPFIAKDSTLYFSSDAHLNLGLLDIFESNILKKDTTDVYIKNLGAPFNSGFDDFAFFINSDTKTGYFSSNRDGGNGGDDIYSFGKYECKQTITGITRNKLSNEPLPKTVVKLMDESGKVIEMVTSDENGFYEFKDVACNSKFVVLAEKVIYRPDQRDIKTSEVNAEETQVDLFLTPLIVDSEIVINPIFFDYDKSNIRPDAAYELENIVVVMREHPNMVIKIESHTDSRGRDKYNEKLSDRRAKSTRDYLFSRGIAKDRIESAIGYGESQLLNKCSNGVKCSEEEHQKNRRSKFIITSGYSK
ncbi:OmpA family protein [Lacinutrix sp. 5H-3-7-4]|uniref:OmpA family protein n=1 Tax=Lacinutrix sp. (strain 5H-3-7-4) TaxID=983544 RepID=UPI00020A3E6D|nr:OmpA family protein [Lacinutrix sp. 5H-3-7-4]AEH02497.1 OmpA/MotB domain protein [Lacinutrix sp. 5H-3-7-4]